MRSCSAGSLNKAADIIRKYAPIPEEKKILVAIAIGYPDEGAMVNRFRSRRELLENVVHWVDLT